MGESDYRPVVEVTVGGNDYEVSGFACEEEADQFVTELDANTNGRVGVRGPF